MFATGSLDTLGSFLAALPRTETAAILLHLPVRAGTLPAAAATALQHSSGRALRVAADGVELQPGSLVVTSPGLSLSFAGDQLVLRPARNPRRADELAHTLAEQLGAQAIFVVLSAQGAGIGDAAAIRKAGGQFFTNIPGWSQTLPAGSACLLSAGELPAKVAEYLEQIHAPTALAPQPAPPHVTEPDGDALTLRHLRMLAAAFPGFVFVTAADFGWEYVNPPFYEFTGLGDGGARGKGWLSAIHDSDQAELSGVLQQAVQGRGSAECEARLRRSDGQWRWYLIRAAPQMAPDGTLLGWVGSFTDIDDRRVAELRQGLLLAELQHRVRNILAVVRSVLNRTLESSTDLDHFAAHLTGRIGALARTQSAAARTPERQVTLEELVHDELACHGGQDDSQHDVEGPSVALSDSVGSTFALAVHELTTNALKYGALSNPAGRLHVRWRLETVIGYKYATRLIFEWRESGVPVTDLKPVRRGFGRELIEQGLPYELGATTALEFRPGGLYCRIELATDSGKQTIRLLGQTA